MLLKIIFSVRFGGILKLLGVFHGSLELTLSVVGRSLTHYIILLSWCESFGIKFVSWEYSCDEEYSEELNEGKILNNPYN